MVTSSSPTPKPVNMNKFDNYLALTFGFLNGTLLMITPDRLNLLATLMSVVVLLLRNFRRIVVTLYDFYLLASAQNRTELKQMLKDWRAKALNPQKDDDE